jgi:hypothetical protein
MGGVKQQWRTRDKEKILPACNTRGGQYLDRPNTIFAIIDMCDAEAFILRGRKSMRGNDNPRLGPPRPSRDDAVTSRALTVGALGPVIVAAGILWSVGRLILLQPALDSRALAFTPAHQLIVAGLFVSAICVPVALEILRTARPQDLEIPEPQPTPEPDSGRRLHRV